ncbi:MAG: hypothetical protein K0Q50_2389, partial [Vampirovibrio sp.]|nr:hypothetical protein [Vampirovibrio sp.]
DMRERDYEGLRAKLNQGYFYLPEDV